MVWFLPLLAVGGAIALSGWGVSQVAKPIEEVKKTFGEIPIVALAETGIGAYLFTKEKKGMLKWVGAGVMGLGLLSLTGKSASDLIGGVLGGNATKDGAGTNTQESTGTQPFNVGGVGGVVPYVDFTPDVSSPIPSGFLPAPLKSIIDIPFDILNPLPFGAINLIQDIFGAISPLIATSRAAEGGNLSGGLSCIDGSRMTDMYLGEVVCKNNTWVQVENQGLIPNWLPVLGWL